MNGAVHRGGFANVCAVAYISSAANVNARTNNGSSNAANGYAVVSIGFTTNVLGGVHGGGCIASLTYTIL